MKLFGLVVSTLLVISCAPLMALSQTGEQAAPPRQLRAGPGTLLPVELVGVLGDKNSQAGTPVTLQITIDMRAPDGTVVIPKGMKVIGHVTEATARQKHQAGEIGLAFDKLIMPDGSEVPITAAIQAIAPARTTGSPGGPNAVAVTVNNAPGVNGPVVGPSAPGISGTGGAGGVDAGGMTNGATSTGSTAAVPMLSSSAEGVVGMKDVSLKKGTMTDSVVWSEKHDITLQNGTQMILRITGDQPQK